MKKTHIVEEILDNFISVNKISGLSLQVVSSGHSFHTIDYGYSNIELSKPMKQDTVNSVMSITKSFTAIAMLHLEENTDFTLDTPIIEYLPYFSTKGGRYDKINSKQILSHTAGFPDNIWIVTLMDDSLLKFAKIFQNSSLFLNKFQTLKKLYLKYKVEKILQDTFPISN